METSKKKSHHSNVLKVFIAALPTIVFGVFTIVFTLQQNESAKAAREQDQRQADETNQRIIFKEYINDMKELLLVENFTKNMDKSLLYMRVQTLTALRHLDVNRKHDVIIFLYENQLIRHDRSPTIELRGADLTDVKFGKSSTEICDFDFLYLPGISARNIVFDGCLLTSARLDDASMNNAQFHSCLLVNASFINANLMKAQLRNNQLYNATFTNALLTETSIKGGVFQSVNLMNTDLYKSDINDELLYPLNIGGVAPNKFRNTRFPNRSFSDIYTENLFDETTSQCNLNTNVRWKDMTTDQMLSAIDSRTLNLTNMSVAENACFFVLAKSHIAVQGVSVQIFSLLIDSEQAMFNLTALIGLKNPDRHDEISMAVHFVQDKGSFDYSRAVKESIRNNTSIQHYSFINKVPPNTRHIVISLICDAVSSKDQQCFFDQIKIGIFKN